jgi:hypothetical protein
VSVSGENMGAIARAKAQHNANCPGPATGVKMHPLEIERCGWEEGDNIAGLILQADPTIGTGTFKVVCGLNDPGELEIEDTVEIDDKVGV